MINEKLSVIKLSNIEQNCNMVMLINCIKIYKTILANLKYFTLNELLYN